MGVSPKSFLRAQEASGSRPCCWASATPHPASPGRSLFSADPLTSRPRHLRFRPVDGLKHHQLHPLSSRIQALRESGASVPQLPRSLGYLGCGPFTGPQSSPCGITRHSPPEVAGWTSVLCPPAPVSCPPHLATLYLLRVRFWGCPVSAKVPHCFLPLVKDEGRC